MNTLSSIGRVALREISARRVLVPAAVVLGTLTMVALRSLDPDNGDADGLINGTWIATLVISVIVGMSLLGDELANGRLSFYFARPFSPAAIFGGKLVGGIALALAIQGAVIALVAVGLPAIAWQDSQLAERTVVSLIGERIIATFACVTLGIAIGIVVQSRTRWLVLDVTCAGLVAVTCLWAVLHVTPAIGARDAHGVLRDRHVGALEVAAFGVALLGLAFATGRALARGRTDRERAHATLSATLWPILVPAAGALLAVTSAWF